MWSLEKCQPGRWVVFRDRVYILVPLQLPVLCFPSSEPNNCHIGGSAGSPSEGVIPARPVDTEEKRDPRLSLQPISYQLWYTVVPLTAHGLREETEYTKENREGGAIYTAVGSPHPCWLKAFQGWSVGDGTPTLLSNPSLTLYRGKPNKLPGSCVSQGSAE